MVFSRPPAKGGLQLEFAQMLQHMLPRGILAAPPCRYGRQFQLLTQNVPAKSRKKGHESRALHQAAAERVGDANVPRAGRLDQSRHTQYGIVAELQRVAKIIIYPAENNINR